MSTIDRNPSEGLNAAVAAELRRERAAQQVTIDTLVERTGLSRSTILNTLNAKRLLGVEAVASIAQALEVSVTTIFARAEGRISAATPDTTFAVEATTPDTPLTRNGLRDLIAAIVDASQVDDPEWGDLKCA